MEWQGGSNLAYSCLHNSQHVVTVTRGARGRRGIEGAAKVVLGQVWPSWLVSLRNISIISTSYFQPQKGSRVIENKGLGKREGEGSGFHGDLVVSMEI